MTGHTPKALAAMPILRFDHAVDLEAFFTISPGRSASMNGIGPIPMTEVVAYLQLYPVRDRDRFVRLIRGMDLHYLQAVHQKRTRKREYQSD